MKLKKKKKKDILIKTASHQNHKIKKKHEKKTKTLSPPLHYCLQNINKTPICSALK